MCFLALVAHLVKNSSAMRETWVGSLGWEDPLEEEITTCSSTLATILPSQAGVWEPRIS